MSEGPAAGAAGEEERGARHGGRGAAATALVLLLAVSLAANALLFARARAASERAASAERRAESLSGALERSGADREALLHGLAVIRGRAVSLQQTAREIERLAASAVASYPEPAQAEPAGAAETPAPEQ